MSCEAFEFGPVNKAFLNLQLSAFHLEAQKLDGVLGRFRFPREIGKATLAKIAVRRKPHVGVFGGHLACNVRAFRMGCLAPSVPTAKSWCDLPCC